MLGVRKKCSQCEKGLLVVTGDLPCVGRVFPLGRHVAPCPPPSSLSSVSLVVRGVLGGGQALWLIIPLTACDTDVTTPWHYPNPEPNRPLSVGLVLFRAVPSVLHP